MSSGGGNSRNIRWRPYGSAIDRQVTTFRRAPLALDAHVDLAHSETAQHFAATLIADAHHAAALEPRTNMDAQRFLNRPTEMTRARAREILRDPDAQIGPGPTDDRRRAYVQAHLVLLDEKIGASVVSAWRTIEDYRARASNITSEAMSAVPAEAGGTDVLWLPAKALALLAFAFSEAERVELERDWRRVESELHAAWERSGQLLRHPPTGETSEEIESVFNEEGRSKRQLGGVVGRNKRSAISSHNESAARAKANNPNVVADHLARVAFARDVELAASWCDASEFDFELMQEPAGHRLKADDPRHHRKCLARHLDAEGMSRAAIAAVLMCTAEAVRLDLTKKACRAHTYNSVV